MSGNGLLAGRVQRWCRATFRQHAPVCVLVPRSLLPKPPASNHRGPTLLTLSNPSHPQRPHFKHCTWTKFLLSQYLTIAIKFQHMYAGTNSNHSQPVAPCFYSWDRSPGSLIPVTSLLTIRQICRGPSGCAFKILPVRVIAYDVLRQSLINTKRVGLVFCPFTHRTVAYSLWPHWILCTCSLI